MDTSFRLFPESASTHAPRVDAVYLYLMFWSVVIVVIVAGLILYYAVKYRWGSLADRGPLHPRYRIAVESFYITAPVFVFASFFFWGAVEYFHTARPPDDALVVTVLGKQWMWHTQHTNGRREINELHVPQGRNVRLVMISQDVIHSFFIPAFRLKHDVLPGRYTQAWFHATALGEYHLFCAEYCGTNHSRMIGRVIVMRPSEYQAWLAGNVGEEPPTVAGARLFEELRCSNCHRGAAARCPPLEGLFRSQVKLQDGSTVLADEQYIRDSILRPSYQIVAGYQPIMPSFEGQLSEEGLLNLIAYIRSLAAERGTSE